MPFRLHRLDRPAAIDLNYRSKRLEHTFEALGLLAALIIGLLLSNAGLRACLVFVLIGGFGALVWEGMAPSSLSGFLKWFYLGVMLSVAWWFVVGAARLLRRCASARPPGQPPDSMPNRSRSP